MALKVGDKIITGSAAAGPALEGQHVENGMLAAPGAISDLRQENGGYRCLILNTEMQPEKGDLIALDSGAVLQKGQLEARGVTGTGVIATVSQGIDSGLVSLPNIKTASNSLHLSNGIRFSKKDLIEAGKAIGAIRAGYLTLAAEAGVSVEDIRIAFMAGASGTYVDARKAMSIGMVPPRVREIYQVGNTSLLLAREIVQDPQRLKTLDEIARQLQASHCMFGLSKVFEKAYLLELSYWTEGLPWELYKKYAKMYQLPELPQLQTDVNVIKKVTRDIRDIGKEGLITLERVGKERCWPVPGCINCGQCVEECPENAVKLDDTLGVVMRMDRCSGTACQRCEHICPEKVFRLSEFWMNSLHTRGA
jgi:methylamine methyltransferase corrinoid protein reductive activase